MAEFWSDGVRTFDELSLLGCWSGALFDDDPVTVLRRLADVLQSRAFEDVGLSSERPDERAAVQARLDHLARDGVRLSDYTRLLGTVWAAIAPTWEGSGQTAVRRACAIWTDRLTGGASLTALLPPDHAVFAMGLTPLLEAGLNRGDVVVTPCYFQQSGHIVDLSRVLSVGVSTTAIPFPNQFVVRGRSVARFGRTIGETKRAAILAVLMDGPATVAQIPRGMEATESSARGHLRILKMAGLITSAPGQPVLYSVVERSIERALNEVSARLHGDHGRAARIHSHQSADGADFAAIFDRAPIAIVQLDLRGRCLSCNPATQVMLGYSAAQLSQLRGHHLLADEADGDTFEAFDLPGRAPRRSEVRLRRRDGSVFWGAVTLSLVCDEAGAPKFTYVMLEDLSHRRGAEDLVTGLPNRALFETQLVRLLAMARRGSYGAAVLVLDLDGFKAINDRLGHNAGDLLLREVGARLVSTLRAGDIVGRLGGDEFGVLPMSAATVDSATQVAEKIGAALRRPFLLNGIESTIAASIGIALIPHHGSTVETLMKYADNAMYAAKRSGVGYRFGEQQGTEGGLSTA